MKKILLLLSILLFGVFTTACSEEVKPGYTEIAVYSVEEDGERSLEDFIRGYNIEVEKKDGFTIITEEDKVTTFEDVVIEIKEVREKYHG